MVHGREGGGGRVDCTGGQVDLSRDNVTGLDLRTKKVG